MCSSASIDAAREQRCFLLVSDVHCNVAQTKEVVRRLTEHSVRVDTVLLCGDMANVWQPIDEASSEMEEATRQVWQIIQTLAQLAPVYFVPGNHDPTCFFKDSVEAENMQLLHPVHNMHRRVAHLAPGLALAGLGGAMPGVSYVQPEQKVWHGYPYADDKAFSEDVYQLEQNCIAFSNQHASADTSLQWIWLTHCGPAGLSTTDANLKPYDPASRIQSGSHALYKLIAEHSKPDDGMDLLMNLHGHTHASWGQVQVGSTHVINPGSLAEKRYAILKLTRDTAGTGRWYLTSVEFILAQS